MITLRDFLAIILFVFIIGTFTLMLTHFLVGMQGVSFNTIVITFFVIDFSLAVLLLIDLVFRIYKG